MPSSRTIKFLLFMFAIGCFASFAYLRHTAPLQLETAYGTISIHEPVLKELLACKAVQRLKNIHQYGPLYQMGQCAAYSRYDHSIGVFALIRKFNRPLEEQIAGLLHDASHTVFSHVGDYFDAQKKTGKAVVRFSESKDSYQDDIHKWALERLGVGKILEKHGYTLDDIDHKNAHFTCLEQEYPDMCADRIDYNLQGGWRRGLISQQDMMEVYNDLRFANDTWYFRRSYLAKRFANLSLNMTEKLWSSADGLYLYTLVSDMMHHAVKQGLITMDDVHFSDDPTMWTILTESDDEYLRSKYLEVLAYKGRVEIQDELNHDLYLKGKFRGIDPLVRAEGTFKRLTSLEYEYKKEYRKVKAVLDKGWFIKIRHLDEVLTDTQVFADNEAFFAANSVEAQLQA